MDRFKKRLAEPREQLLQQLAGPQTPKEWAKRARGAADKARRAAESLDSEGRWLKNDRIDGSDFTRNLNALSYYVEAAKKAAP